VSVPEILTDILDETKVPMIEGKGNESSGSLPSMGRGREG
jgi:hypothetical protein